MGERACPRSIRVGRRRKVRVPGWRPRLAPGARGRGESACPKVARLVEIVLGECLSQVGARVGGGRPWKVRVPIRLPIRRQARVSACPNAGSQCRLPIPAPCWRHAGPGLSPRYPERARRIPPADPPGGSPKRLRARIRRTCRRIPRAPARTRGCRHADDRGASRRRSRLHGLAPDVLAIGGRCRAARLSVTTADSEAPAGVRVLHGCDRRGLRSRARTAASAGPAARRTRCDRAP